MEGDHERQQIALLILRDFETQRLPRALSLKRQVEAGEPISDNDICFLEGMLRDIDRTTAVLGQYSVIRPLKTCASRLQEEITILALRNKHRRAAFDQ